MSVCVVVFFVLFFFFFNDTATTEIYTLSLHDALPISKKPPLFSEHHFFIDLIVHPEFRKRSESTRLNSSHQIISYAVFCLKKNKKKTKRRRSIPPSRHHFPRPT